MRKLKPLIFIPLIVLSFLLLQAQPLGGGPNDTIYDPIQIDEEKLAKLPVERLTSYLQNGLWHVTREVFGDYNTYENFCSQFDMFDSTGTINGKFFIKNFIVNYINTVTSQSQNPWCDYLIELELRKDDDPANSMTLNCLSVYDTISKQYYINNITYIGNIQTNNSGNKQMVDVNIPDILESPCVPKSETGFEFIRLQNRENPTSPINPHLILGKNPNIEIKEVPEDYFNTTAFRQLEFSPFEFEVTLSIINPLWIACTAVFSDETCANWGISKFITITETETYSPGFVLSIQDLINNDMKDADGNLIRLYADIYDATGVLNLPDVNGNLKSYPTGITLDRIWKRVVLTSSEDNTIRTIEGFSDPLAVFILGQYLYVLDKGVQAVKIYKLFVNNADELAFTFVSNTNFGLNLDGATDLTGFSTNNANVLYISNALNKLIYRLILDPNTGLLKSGADGPRILDQFTDFKGHIHDLTGISRIESSPRVAGHNVILAIDKRRNTALSFSTDGLASSSDLDLIVKSRFTQANSKLTNIGYNLGNNAFYITDKKAAKIHVFSNDGFYLGSGGSFGTSETNEKLFYPNAISSNTFANNANEMVVANRWGQHTGFKRIQPFPDIADLEVIDKAPLSEQDLNDNALFFRHTLTAGFGVYEIKIKLNGQDIKTQTSSFFPNRYSHNFLANNLDDILNYGWNTYSVTMKASVPGPGGNVNFQKTKSIEFYFIPSSFTQDFTADNAPPANLIHNKTDKPFIIYKNIFVPGGDFPAGINFTLKNGKTIFLEGCTLSISMPTFYIALNEDFEFACGSNLELRMKKYVNKTSTDCKFDGTFHNYNMISSLGDYTGGVNSGSAPSSELEFIGCEFKNYLGKAVHVIEGRATVADCIFESTINQGPIFDPDLTAVGVVVAPLARLDVRGGSFINNDIAIDANNAQLYIGHPASVYKGRPVDNPLFIDNQIAIHSYNSFTRIRYTNFKDNTAALLDLNGTIDISKNSNNFFEDNISAIIFSNTIFARMGKNKFINNNVDITYLVPPGVLTSTDFNFRCNYWENSSIIGTPIIDIIAEPPYDTSSGVITFNVVPFLIKKDVEDEPYICTGNGDKNSSSNKLAFDDEPDSSSVITYHQYHIKFAEINKLITKGLHKKAYIEISKLIENASNELTYYLNYNDTIDSYHESMLKNTLYSYIISAHLAKSNNFDLLNYKQFLDYLVEPEVRLAYPDKDFYVWVTQDRLAFLEFFLKDEKDLPATEEVIESNLVFIYPNPFSETATILINIKDDGNYTFVIYDIQGKQIKKIFTDRQLDSGQYTFELNIANIHPGLYFGVLKGNNNAIVGSSKFILTN